MCGLLDMHEKISTYINVCYDFEDICCEFLSNANIDSLTLSMKENKITPVDNSDIKKPHNFIF